MNETSKTVEQAVAAAQVPGDFPTRAELEGQIAGTVEAIARGRGDGGTIGVVDAGTKTAAQMAAEMSAASGLPVEVGPEPGQFTITADPDEKCDHGVLLSDLCADCGTESRVLATLAPDTDLGADDAGTGGSGVGIETESTTGTNPTCPTCGGEARPHETLVGAWVCTTGCPLAEESADHATPMIPIDLRADAPPPVDVPLGRDTTRVLVCTLSAEDTANRGVELAQKLQELADAVDELKTIGHVKREHIKRLEGDVQRLKTATLDRTESRETPVREVRDYKTGTVKFYRMDTCQEVTSLLRQMTEAEKDEERQVPLFSEGGNATVANDPPPPATDGGILPGEADGVDAAAATEAAKCEAVLVTCASCPNQTSTCDDEGCILHDDANTGIFLGSNRWACSDVCADKADVAEQADHGGEA